ncbi:VOC family protein [Glycomyces paridis]|uniref:Glyoxalase/bleomycin resistance/extradiol dioxygenase family protein n=1 Tax=Glycomyces paridis TaxID=2126555 RepID=A0A4S8PAG6_9ACTN|nr:VOC family protein [Glycomyces paridis]THV27260.1 glyoxalase/bleomycin resistance/extradiol dioxygenase family protein [Glycomyces paridis]
MATKMIFLNLPVADLGRAKGFYEALGWAVNPDFTDENAACVVVDDNICLMLLVKDFYTTFSERPVADTVAYSSAAYALALRTREEVDDLTEAALKAGGAEEDARNDRRVQEAEVGMYGRTFLDPDGHQWEPFFMPYPQS